MSEPIRLCMIDDIPDVVEGISKGIDWQSHGIEVAGTAGNGEDGQKLIRETKPHIVLTDIRMPRLDGLEMMKGLAQEFPFMKVIFLSGYTDFEYAQQAMRLGAFDYIVKPFTPQKIVEVVQKARAAILEEQNSRQRLTEMERKLRESMPYLIQEYFQLLLRFPTDPEQAAKRWDFLSVPLNTVMLVEIDGFAERTRAGAVQEVELIRFTLQNILEETIRGTTKGLIFRDSASRYAVVVNSSDVSSMEALAEQCRENIARYSKFTVSLGIGEEVPHIHQISYSYSQAQTALSYLFYTGGNSVFTYRIINGNNLSVPRYSAEKEKELFNWLRSGNLPKAEQTASELFAAAEGATPPPEQLQSLYFELAFLINRVFAEKLGPEEMKPLEQIVGRLREARSFSRTELEEHILELCRLGCRQVMLQQTDEANRIIEKAKGYIRSNLHVNMTVNDYARQVYLSGSYFANLFKKVTGMTVGQFVTAERMDRARELLAEGKAVQDIAQSLGYEDRQYFSELFKKHTGLTPSEFRQAHTDKGK